jgi:3-methyladenine DNA glycosylase/8-oxoguanine DNA glycosylase
MSPLSARPVSEPVTTLRLPLVGPAGEPVDFRATINSHGVAGLPPVRPDADIASSLDVTLRLGDGAIRTVRLSSPNPREAEIEVLGDIPVNETQVLDVVRHLLRLDQDLSDFYCLTDADPLLAWVSAGSARMMRCATVYEDVVKTILTTNCAWSATVRMVAALVSTLGEPDTVWPAEPPYGRAFPTPEAMATRDEAFYRETIRAGYRAPHLVRLATSVASGELDLEALGRATPEELPDDEVEVQLLALPGVGPYAAAHIMHMLGRCSRLILDSWTRPTYARLLGLDVLTDSEIRSRFESYDRYAGLAFWMTVTKGWFEGQAAGEAG